MHFFTVALNPAFNLHKTDLYSNTLSWERVKNGCNKRNTVIIQHVFLCYTES